MPSVLAQLFRTAIFSRDSEIETAVGLKILFF
jgi:hypothetical protein